MKKELQEKLINKYPQFFTNLKNKGIIIPIQFGIECNDGWYWLLDNLMNQLKNYMEYNSERKRIKNKHIRKFINKLNKFSLRLPYKYSKHLNKLQSYIRKNSEVETYQVITPIVITQIKEKFGGLCFYYNGGDDVVMGMTSFAERLSYNICETCGKTENVHQTNNGWIYTICDKCEKKKK